MEVCVILFYFVSLWWVCGELKETSNLFGIDQWFGISGEFDHMLFIDGYTYTSLTEVRIHNRPKERLQTLTCDLLIILI